MNSETELAREPEAVTKATLPLRISGVTKNFNQGATVVRALDAVTLEIERGEFVAIMGASGSGKSTLLHTMAGLTRPDSGAVLVDGQDLNQLNDAALTDFRRRKIGVVFQQFNLIPSLTALENVMLPLMADRSHSAGVMKERGHALLDRLGLAHRASHRPDAMSGGEQQRIAIGRALITDPAIIFADEPTGSLDSVTGASICTLLEELNQKDDRTIVLVTHEPIVAASAGRVVVMKDGAVCSGWRSSEVDGAQGLAARYQDIVAVTAGDR